MNLQVCAPHQECVYNCPFCVARGHKHKYHFKDIYKDGLTQDYFNALKRTIKTCNIDTVIITGECDPTQNMRWARKVAEVAKSCGVRTEIQTHNLSMRMEQLDFVDVVSYSITNAREYLEEFAPVQHGKWVSLVVKKEDWKGVLHDFYQPYSCSVCQNPNTFMRESAFCPHCGAIMDATE